MIKKILKAYYCWACSIGKCGWAREDKCVCCKRGHSL